MLPPPVSVTLLLPAVRASPAPAPLLQLAVPVLPASRPMLLPSASMPALPASAAAWALPAIAAARALHAADGLLGLSTPSTASLLRVGRVCLLRVGGACLLLRLCTIRRSTSLPASVPTIWVCLLVGLGGSPGMLLLLLVAVLLLLLLLLGGLLLVLVLQRVLVLLLPGLAPRRCRWCTRPLPAPRRWAWRGCQPAHVHNSGASTTACVHHVDCCRRNPAAHPGVKLNSNGMQES